MSTIGRSRRLLGLILAVGLTAASCSAEDAGSEVSDDDESESSSVAAEPDTSTQLGIAVRYGRVETIRAVESETGADFEMVRYFARWNDELPNSDLQALIDDGRRLHVSVRPRTTSGENIMWADLAAAEPGSSLYGQFVAWIDRLVALPAGTYLTLNHEPETTDSEANGSAEEYVDVWRRFAELVRERGGEDSVLVWTMTGGAFRDDRADRWYPGDDVVDVIGADVYNWYTCQGTKRSWRELEELLAPPLAFARGKGKPLALPEFASAVDDDDPERKADWINNATQYMTRPDIAADLEFAAWFDVTAPGGAYPDCIWDHDSEPAVALAFGEMVRSMTDQ